MEFDINKISSRSFAGRLAILICLVVGVFIGVAGTVSIKQSIKQIEKTARENAFSKLDLIATKIQDVVMMEYDGAENVSINDIQDVVNEIRPYESAYNIILDNLGGCVAHTEPEKIKSFEKIRIPERITDTVILGIGKEMMEGKRGSRIIYNDNIKSMVFYTAIPDTHLSVAMVCPLTDVFGGLNELGVKLTIILLLDMLLIFILVYHVIKKQTKPLRQFSESAVKIAHGDFNAELPAIKTKDEMMILKESFDYMQKSLTEYIEKLTETTSAKERIESELNIAREIQMSMIPKIFPPYPDRNDIDIYAYMNPAKEVGGDLYDFFIDDNKIYFAVGDVSGKGVPASLFMAVTRSIFRSVATSLVDPAKIITAMNKSIADGNDANMFVTLFVGVYDFSTDKFTFSNAGHNPPVLLSPDGTATFLDMKPCSGIPVGLFPEFSYKSCTIHLDRNSRLVLYSDGLTEAENESKALYSDERLLSLMNMTGMSYMNVRSIINVILKDVEKHAAGAPQSDDLTIMALEFKPDKKDETEKPHIVSLDLESKTSEVTRLSEWVEALCEEHGVAMGKTMQINLAIEEAAVNVINYAYPDNEVNNFRIEFEMGPDRISIWRLIDSGKQFDPTAQAEVDTSLSVEERPIGGLGIHLVKQIMDEVSYERLDGKNILTMTISL